MKNVLDPLTRLPGVRLAALISSDGVPIDIRSNDKPRTSSQGGESGAPTTPELGAEDLNALAALSSCWIAEVTRAVTPLTWGIPQRLVLRAARGTLIVVQAPRAL